MNDSYYNQGFLGECAGVQQAEIEKTFFARCNELQKQPKRKEKKKKRKKKKRKKEKRKKEKKKKKMMRN